MEIIMTEDRINAAKQHIRDFKRFWKEFEKIVNIIAKEKKYDIEYVNIYLKDRRLKVFDLYLLNFIKKTETKFTETNLKKDMNTFFKNIWN